jgi:signal transduction histidine kinase/ActR/RegA family two-component response regulator
MGNLASLAAGDRTRVGRREALAHGVALGGTALIFFVRAGLAEALGTRAPFQLFTFTITVAAWIGGLRPGLLATAIGAALGWVAFVPPLGSITFEDRADVLSTVIFVASGACISVVCERMHRARERARNEEDMRRVNAALEQRVQERTAALQESEQEAARRLAKLQAILGSMEEGLVIVDADGHLVDMNPAALALLRHRTLEEARLALERREELWEVRDLQQRPLSATERPLARALAGDRFSHLVLRLRHRAEGVERTASFSGAAVRDPDGSIVRAILVIRDEGERQQLLESERAARAEAERANRMKDEFLAVISHELRTPLNAILGWASLLRRPHRTGDQLDKGLEVIERNTRLQVQLISDLLDVSRIISGKLHLDLRPVHLPAVVEAALDVVRGAAAAKGIELGEAIAPLDGVVSGDPARLQQIVLNLLSNAVKFTPRGGRVEVSLLCREGAVELAVRDSGAGISAEFLPHVFDRFRQADASTTRQHGGLGLGLAIVAHLVDLHGGAVRADSEGPGRGSTFTVTFPDAADDLITVAAPPFSGQATRLRGVRVLVVDDELDARELAQRLLEDHEATVEVAASAEQALALLRGRAPDVLVSDIGMPGVDGYDLIRRVRQGENGAGALPAIALTAFARAEDRARALAAGYQAHLAKPIEPTELVAAVARLSGEGASPRRAGGAGEP